MIFVAPFKNWLCLSNFHDPWEILFNQQIVISTLKRFVLFTMALIISKTA